MAVFSGQGSIGVRWRDMGNCGRQNNAVFWQAVTVVVVMTEQAISHLFMVVMQGGRLNDLYPGQCQDNQNRGYMSS